MPRAGDQRGRYGNVAAVAWYDQNSGSKTHDVAQKTENARGLYDTLGNVWEWVADWYGAYPNDPVTDPRGPTSGTQRVLRGGSWNFGSGIARASSRFGYVPGDRYNFIGLRCAEE